MMKTWLIGAGEMAQDYCKILMAQSIAFDVIGRSSTSAKSFTAAMNKPVQNGGLVKALQSSEPPDRAIIAVNAESLTEAVHHLMRSGTKRILVEKPGGLNTRNIQALAEGAAEYDVELFVAYNRRFYSATALARNLIAEDGGALSCNFEFTEWSNIISSLTVAAGVKKAWFFANSSHVVDLAFHLCGVPKDWHFWHGGSLDWHPSAARFCGSGITEHNVFFNYHADWEAPGRWGLEVLSRKHRFIFRPMEQLQVIKLGSVKVENMLLDNKLDEKYKPGLFLQTKAFLDEEDELLCSINEQLNHCWFYEQMAGYKAKVGPN